MTSVPAAPDGGFKRCCLNTGEYDGSNRHYFFPGVAVELGARQEIVFLRNTLDFRFLFAYSPSR